VDLRPTSLRTNPHYVRIYILWMNLFFHIIGPFILLVPALINFIFFITDAPGK
jgi:hypothetical protein